MPPTSAPPSGDLERALATALGRPVAVLFGDARHTVVHAAERGGTLVVRLNRFFAEAPDEVRAALARWLGGGRGARRAGRELDDWIDVRLARLHREAPLSVALRTAGEHHDLARLSSDLLAGPFSGAFAPSARPRITWGRAGKSRSRRSLRLGSYDPFTRVVRIHPVLDQPFVPEWFVRFILFHELLHAELEEPGKPVEPRPMRAPGARRRHHGPEFRRRERAHPDCARALAWERRHVRALIRSARSGKPVSAARRPARAPPLAPPEPPARRPLGPALPVSGRLSAPASRERGGSATARPSRAR
jgi:hypothetical protein